MHTAYPVYCVDRKYHADPARMRLQLMAALDRMPGEVDTVLAAMGFCGGSWDEIETDKRIIIPKVDDCITLLLHRDDTPAVNLKEPAHIYMRDSDSAATSYGAMKERLCREHGEKEGAAIFESWFRHITHVDIIDTGLYDSRAPQFCALAQENAGLIGAALQHVPGSNLILEKLVSGRWDGQFVVKEPHCPMSRDTFGLRPWGREPRGGDGEQEKRGEEE